MVDKFVLDELARPFNEMGAGLLVSEVPTNSPRQPFRVDVQGKVFSVDLPEDMQMQVLDADPKDRHFLLMLSREGTATDGDRVNRFRYLCGHDERAFFVAAVPGLPKSVAEAKEVLMPPEAQAAIARYRSQRKRAKRHGIGKVMRQGEWFFVPSNIVPNPIYVLRNEPIRRNSRSKPHMCEFLYRRGGDEVFICDCNIAPTGASVSQCQKFDREARAGGGHTHIWKPMTRDAQVFVRGRISHPDHKTLVLRGWYQVFPNTESKAPHAPSVAFLD